MAEHWVCLLAAWKGAEVYKNFNSTGKSDLIIVVDDVAYQCDVKLARPNNEGSWRGNTDQVKDPVIPIIVCPINDDISTWKVQWIRNRHPKELTDFWKKNALPFTYANPN